MKRRNSVPVCSATAWDLLQRRRRRQEDPSVFWFRRQQQCKSDSDDLPSTNWLQLHPGRIHEISGAGGSGKTQIVLQLCLQVAAAAVTATAIATTGNSISGTIIPATSTSPPASDLCQAVYISFQGKAKLAKALQRLQQMAVHGYPQFAMNGTATPLLRRILTRSCSSTNTDDFRTLLDVELPALFHERRQTAQQQQNIHDPQQIHKKIPTILVLDSLADLMRGITTGPSQPKHRQHATRAAWLFYTAAQLRKLADHFEIVIVVVNQVSLHDHTPALGLAWRHCVHTALLVQRHQQSTDYTSHNDNKTMYNDENNHQQNHNIRLQNIPIRSRTTHRMATLLKSLNHPCGQEIQFVIDSGGVFIT